MQLVSANVLQWRHITVLYYSYWVPAYWLRIGFCLFR